MSVFHVLNRMIFFVMVFLLPPDGRAFADTYGLIGRSLSDPALIEIWRGCEAVASKQDDHCMALGATGQGHPRVQKRLLDEALHSHRFKALGISVMHSELIAETFISSPLPMITVDQPLESDGSFHASHIGVDNLALGKAIASVVNRLRPQGGKLCIMTSYGFDYDGMQKRLLGFRRGLGGGHLKDGQRLNGHRGWQEVSRCPWDNGQRNERALTQLDFTLNNLDLDVFVTLDNTLLIDPRAYQKVLSRHQKKIQSGKITMMLAVSGMRTEYNQLMRDKLVHGLLMINYFQLGQNCYHLMKALVSGEKIPSSTMIRSHKFYMVETK